MHQYRVTKYNPKFRDALGSYTKDDWTSFKDIGHLFGGLTLTEEEYLRVESAYIDVAIKFLTTDDSPALRAVGVENHANFAHAPTEGALIGWRDLPVVCRSILREDYWCKLEVDGRFLHFGYDYYLYVGVKSKCDDLIATANAMGLFVEPFDSPYLETDERNA
jgi:hypothetical protein